MRYMKKPLILVVSFVLMFLFNFIATPVEASTSFAEYDLNKIEQTAQNVDGDKLLNLAKEFSIPLLIVAMVLSVFLFLGGIIFKWMRVAAGSLFTSSIFFFIVVNWAPDLAGILIGAIDYVMGRITGE